MSIKNSNFKKIVIFFIICIVFFVNINLFANEITDENLIRKENTVMTEKTSTRSNRFESQATDQVREFNTNSFNNMLPDQKISRNNPIVAITRKIISILQLVGIGVALIMLIVTGIKFITAKEKPKITDVVINYVFGVFCIFGATGILTVIQQLVNEFVSIV